MPSRVWVRGGVQDVRRSVYWGHWHRCVRGCVAGAAVTLPCATTDLHGSCYNNSYSDDSLVCASAIHAGIIPDTGGVFSVRLRRGYGPRAGRDWMGHNEDIVGTLRNGIQSDGLPGGAVVLRVFTVHDYPIATVEVQTIAGAPNAPLESNCAHLDGRPPQEMKVAYTCLRHACERSSSPSLLVVGLAVLASVCRVDVHQHDDHRLRVLVRGRLCEQHDPHGDGGVQQDLREWGRVRARGNVPVPVRVAGRRLHDSSVLGDLQEPAVRADSWPWSP